MGCLDISIGLKAVVAFVATVCTTLARQRALINKRIRTFKLKLDEEELRKHEEEMRNHYIHIPDPEDILREFDSSIKGGRKTRDSSMLIDHNLIDR